MDTRAGPIGLISPPLPRRRRRTSFLLHRLSGYPIPRDAALQFPAGRVVDPPYTMGDLLFFHSDSDPNRISHVGISTGGWNMIHSSRSRNGVYEEDVQASENLQRTFA